VKHLTVYDMALGVYVGPKSDHIPPEGKLPQLQALGITRVVNLWHRRDPDLAATFEYVHYPIPDGKTIPDGLEPLAVLIADHVGDGTGKVFIQCHGGRNRSVLLAGLVLRELAWFTGAEAATTMVERRSNALGNPAFFFWLSGASQGGRP
jgi:protein-tyrosine phosphatase